MSTSPYPELTQAQAIFKSLVWTPLIQAGETALFIQFPLLALPVEKEIDTALINWATDDLYAWLCTQFDMAAVKWVNPIHQKAFEDASLKLKIIGAEKGVHSPEYEKGIQDETTALQSFIHFNG